MHACDLMIISPDILWIKYKGGVQARFPELEIKCQIILRMIIRVWTTLRYFQLFWLTGHACYINKWKELSIRPHSLHEFLICWWHKCRQMKQNSFDYVVSLSAKSNFPSCLRMRSHDYIRNTSPSYFSAVCNSLLWLRAPIQAENTWNNQMCTCSPPFLSFFFSLPKHKCTDMYNRTLTHARTHTGTTFMPCDLARHYANGQTCHLPEISETERESETEGEREKEWE